MEHEQMEQQLQVLFTAQHRPPVLRQWQLQRLAKQREQRRLLLTTVFLSACWNLLCLLVSLRLMQQNPALGMGLLCLLLLGLLSAGLLATALLKTEQQTWKASLKR